MSKVLNRPRPCRPPPPRLFVSHSAVHNIAVQLRDTLQEAPGLAAAIAGAVGTNQDGTALLAVPRAVPVLVAVAGYDAVHTWRPLDGDGTATSVTVAGAE